MQTQKQHILDHMMKQIPAFVTVDSVVMDRWTGVSGRHIGDGKFERRDDPKEYRLGDTWDTTYDETIWFSTQLRVPERFDGKKIYLEFDFGGEAIVRINGAIAGGVSSDRHGWVYRDKIFVPMPLPEDRILNIELEATVNAGAYYDEAIAIGASCVHYPISKANLIAVDEATESYVFDIQNVRSAIPVIKDPAIADRVYAALDDSLHTLDFDFGADAFRASVPAAAKVLWDKLDRIPKFSMGEVIMTGHSHIDVAWLWTVKETTRKCGRTFSNTVALMDRYPDFIFAQSQAYLYDKAKAIYPEVYEKMRDCIARGQWDVVGNAWVEADTNVTSGESLIRQLLYGRELFRREFGKESDIYWLPDCFGFSWALPQIIRRSGMKYFVTAKLAGQDTNRFPDTVFRWKGIDGSEILAYLQRTSYNGEYDAPQICKSWEDDDQKNVTDTAMGMFAYGDGGGGATYVMMENARRLSRIPGLPRSRVGHAEEFFRAVEPSWDELPVWEDEMYYENHRGTYSSQEFMKKNNRQCEFLLTRAEMAGVMAGMDSDELLHGDLLTAWHMALVNQFHDILPGTSIRETYANCREEYKEIHRIGDAVLGTALAKIASGVPGAGRSVVFFNLLAADTRGAVTAALPAGFPADAAGDPLPGTEFVREGVRYVTFMPDAPIPAMGYRRFGLTDAPAVCASPVIAEPTRLENSRLRVTLDGDGNILSIYDKKAERETLDGRGNRLIIYQDKPGHESAWNLESNYVKKYWTLDHADRVEVITSGGAAAGLRITYTFHQSTITQELWLAADSNRLDFCTTSDWNETHKMLRASFDVAVRAAYASYEIAHGTICRPTHSNTTYEQAKFEVSAHKWIDLSEGGYGVSLLNDCKYGHDIHGNVMSITLMRSPTIPDAGSDKGYHSFTYSYYPHEGTWQEAGTVREALALNVKPYGVEIGAQTGDRPESFSFVRCSAPSMVIDALKPAQDGDGYILRMYEAEARRGTATVELAIPFTRVTETNMMEVDETEADVNGGSFRFTFRPYEVRTFRIR